MSNSIIQVPSQSSGTQPPQIKIDIGADAVIFGSAILYLFVDKVIRPIISNRINKAFVPIEEERRLSNILAQIGILLNSSRVLLVAFHNGQISNAGYHLQKITTVNHYTAPGEQPMAEPIKDLPIGRIMNELDSLLKTTDWVDIKYDEDLPDACKNHLKRNNIYVMKNKLIRVGNLPIGILSVQYSQSGNKIYGNCCYESITKEYESIVDDLYNEIVTIMEKRIVHPSPVHRIFGTLIGTLKIK